MKASNKAMKKIEHQVQLSSDKNPVQRLAILSYVPSSSENVLFSGSSCAASASTHTWQIAGRKTPPDAC